MKIGIISDTHIPRNARNIPQAVYQYFDKVDMIIHAGDLIELKVLDELRAITPNVEAVLGNMDPPENASALPIKRIINKEGVKIGIMHGSGSPFGIEKRLLEVFKDDKPDVIIFGHTHQPQKQVVKGVLFVNPGSATDKKFTSINSIALLNIENGKYEAEIITL